MCKLFFFTKKSGVARQPTRFLSHSLSPSHQSLSLSMFRLFGFFSTEQRKGRGEKERKKRGKKRGKKKNQELRKGREKKI